MAVLLLSEALVGCKAKSTAQDGPAPKPSASGVVAVPQIMPQADIDRTVNPSAEKPYTGPVGAVKGIVRAAGDPPPIDAKRVSAIPAEGECAAARAVYERAFRVGEDRALADVLVGVTGYEGFLPARGDGPLVTVRGCAFDTRTIALMLGQRISVLNKGGQACIPELLGQPSKALLVVVPGSEPQHLFPSKVGHYALVDDSHAFATADVFVVKFPTFDVTGADGRFEVGKLPAGKVKVSAYLPATGKTVERDVDIVAGQTTELELEIPFDAARDTVRGLAEPRPAPSASAAPSAAPSASGH